MLTTNVPGNNLRQAAFFTALFLPLLAGLFILGVFMGRTTSWEFVCALGLGGALVLGSVIFLGIDWRIGLYMIFFFVLWDRILGFGEYGNLNATKVAIGLTIIFMMTAVLNHQVPLWWKKLGDPLVLSGIAFLICSCIAIPFMTHPEVGYDYLFRRLNVVVLMTVIMVAIYNRNVFHWCIIALIVGGTLVGLATSTEAFTGQSLLQQLGKSVPPDISAGFAGRGVNPVWKGSTRLIGPSGDPNFYGLAQSVPGVLCVGLLLYYREWWKKGLCLFSLCVIGFNILGTGSRSGALAFVAGSAFVFLMCPVKHRVVKLIIVGALATAAAFGLLALDTGIAVDRLLEPDDAGDTLSNRIAFWRMALHLWLDHPWAGVGTNGWVIYYDWYKVPDAPSRYLRPHNTFMQLLAENGVQGVLSYLFLYFFANFSAITAALACRDRRLKFEAMALAALTVCLFIFAGTSNVLENELYFLVFGLCGAAYYIYQREATHPWEVDPADQLEIPAKYRRIAMLKAAQDAAYPPGT